MKRLILVAMLVAGCGGTSQEPIQPAETFDAGPFVPPDQFTVETHITGFYSGIDCSAHECPRYGNLKCVTVPGASHPECQFVMRPQDTCETGFAPLTAATWNREITREGVTYCVKECIRFDDRHGVQFWCPNDTQCVDKVAAQTPDGGTELHGGCLH